MPSEPAHSASTGFIYGLHSPSSTFTTAIHVITRKLDQLSPTLTKPYFYFSSSCSKFRKSQVTVHFGIMTKIRIVNGVSLVHAKLCCYEKGLMLKEILGKFHHVRLYLATYFIQSLQSQDDGNIAVLEMLTVLPEEVVNNQSTNCKIVQPTEASMAKSQVRAGCFSEIPQGLLPAHPFLNFVFNSLQVSSSFDLAIEVLVELVSRHEVTVPLGFYDKCPVSVSFIERHGGDRFLLDTVQTMYSSLQEQADVAA